MARVSRRSTINVEMSEHEFLLALCNIRDTGSATIMTQDGPINLFTREVSPEMAKEIDLTMKEFEDAVIKNESHKICFCWKYSDPLEEGISKLKENFAKGISMDIDEFLKTTKWGKFLWVRSNNLEHMINYITENHRRGEDGAAWKPV